VVVVGAGAIGVAVVSSEVVVVELVAGWSLEQPTTKETAPLARQERINFFIL
jgi:hypothetical protein